MKLDKRVACIMLAIFISLIAGSIFLQGLNKNENSKDRDILENEDIITKYEKNESLEGFLFVGDSFTYRLTEIINSKVENSNIRAINGVRSDYWVANFSEMPDEGEVSGVSLLIGINGFGSSSNLDDTKILIDKLSDKYKSKKVFVQRLFPLGKECWGFETEQEIKAINDEITDFNKSIEAHCETKKNVVFIDTTSGFIDEDGFLINCDMDGLHIDRGYNQMYFENIEKQIMSHK